MMSLTWLKVKVRNLINPLLYSFFVTPIEKSKSFVKERSITDEKLVSIKSKSFLDYLPKKLFDGDQGKFKSKRISAFYLHNVFLDVRSGFLYDRNGLLLLESGKNRSRILANGKLFLFKRNYSLKAGNWSSIQTGFKNNWYHLWIESLYRLVLLNKLSSPLKVFLCNENQEITRILNKPSFSNFEFFGESREPFIKIENFVFVPFLYDSWNIPLLDVRLFSEFDNLFLSGLESRSEKWSAFKKVYISRNRSLKRKCQNEDQLVRFLKKQGVSSVNLEDLSLMDQIALFHQVEFVVGVHGAGLVNIIFSKSCVVLEICSLAITPVYFFLAESLDHRYFYYLPAGASFRSPEERFYRDEDVSVDIEEFSKVFLKATT